MDFDRSRGTSIWIASDIYRFKLDIKLWITDYCTCILMRVDTNTPFILFRKSWNLFRSTGEPHWGISKFFRIFQNYAIVNSILPSHMMEYIPENSKKLYVDIHKATGFRCMLHLALLIFLYIGGDLFFAFTAWNDKSFAYLKQILLKFRDNFTKQMAKFTKSNARLTNLSTRVTNSDKRPEIESEICGMKRTIMNWNDRRWDVCVFATKK